MKEALQTAHAKRRKAEDHCSQERLALRRDVVELKRLVAALADRVAAVGS